MSDTRPPSALFAAEPQPFNPDEIRATKSPGESAILEALGGLRGEVRERFEKIEDAQAKQGKALSDLAGEVVIHHKQLAHLSEAQVSTAKAAATAAEISAKAIGMVHTAQDDMRKMVEGAMTIQRGALESAVRAAVQPIRDDVDKQNEAVGAIINELGLEDRVVLGREVKPGDKKPVRALEKLDTRARQSTLVQALIAIGVIVEAIWRFTH